MIESVIRFFKSFDFYKSFILTLSILISLFFAWQFNRYDIGMGLIIGMFACAPADIPGGRRHRVIGLLVANLFTIFATLIINLTAFNLWLLVPVLGILVFAISIISVYGFRASLVSFAGLLAIVFSFAHPQTGTALYLHLAMIGVGGLWYLIFAQLSHLLADRNHTSQLMAECMLLTSQYLRVKAQMTFNAEENEELLNELFELQTQLNEKHETLREILLVSRKHFGLSNFAKRQVLIFIELIDILELAIANLAGRRDDSLFADESNGRFNSFSKLAFEIADRLEYFSRVMGDRRALNENQALDRFLDEAREEIKSYANSGKSAVVRENVLHLQNKYDYLHKLVQKLEVIENVMNNLYNRNQVWLRGKYSARFITQQDYDFKNLAENISLKSPIFRHSLRLAVTVLVGLIVGAIFPFQNSYWILLTIIVIMRPGYSLTKQRSKQRIYGTLIGAGIAVVIVLITQNLYVYGVLAGIAFLMAFALVQRNYKSSATFITLSIVFIYAIIQPNVLNVIQFRVIDTLTGAALAIIANTFLWPSWESLSINEFIVEAIQSNMLYLREVDNYYHHKNNTDPSYKLSRKNAFLAIGNLNAAFQRMAQEPKSKQKNLSQMYEVVTLNHTFLSLAAALGTYIHNHKTTEASRYFEMYISSICENLDIALKTVNDEYIHDHEIEAKVAEAQQYLDDQYHKLVSESDGVEPGETSKVLITPEIQEIRLISEQLKWLYSISENIKKVVGARGV
ncbi:YccS family putative transporter [Fulvivirga kasyanovii]|uniref:FUSC family protein n=1 Tax=Fulvivirga kasyanovii TaxID=396812 RepID=A0ABW9RKB8_9BACT|nr:FUSC family membrane protein [Fulvivirga kasyanovii]MTI23824.1 FUSC family protein [Fulvivirga kasyanovii]